MQHVNLNQVNFKVHAHSCSNHALCLCVLLSVSGGVWEPRLASHRAGKIRSGDEDRRHQRKHAQSRGVWLRSSTFTAVSGSVFKYNPVRMVFALCSHLHVALFPSALFSSRSLKARKVRWSENTKMWVNVACQLFYPVKTWAPHGATRIQRTDE